MKIIKTLTSIFSLLGIWLIYYLALPTLSIAYFSGFLFFAFVAIVIAANITMWTSNFNNDRFVWQPLVITIGLTVVVLIAGGIFGSPLFNSTIRYEQLGEVEKKDFNDMIKEIDTSQIPIVDKTLAKKMADKKMGEDPALGSRTILGDGTIQNVNGELLYVFPIEHSGLWKWNKFKSTPGYITVSACNANNVKYVTSLNGNDIKNIYLSSSFFATNIKRHIRNNGFRTVGLTEYTYELNDEGRPYFVVTAYKNKTLWGSPEATGVIIVDAQTGEIEFYENAPNWVDIIQPESFIENQIDNWGKYVHGVFNWSNEDKIKKTDLVLTVYSNDECYYFTGMTSVGSDDSCVGFIMVNTRNKKASMSYMSGATEPAAMTSASGLVSDYGYTPTEPLPLNINGIPTYVMALKDYEGLIKSYAMVNIENYSIAVKGDTLAQTSKAYMQAIAKNGSNQLVASNEAFMYEHEGKVTRFSTVVSDGFTYHYMLIDGKEQNIFTASSLISDELPLTREGDIVKVSYIDDKNGTIDITSFDNLNISTPTSADQEKLNDLDVKNPILESDLNNIIEIDPNVTNDTWDNMTDEEKAKILDSYKKNNPSE